MDYLIGGNPVVKAIRSSACVLTYHTYTNGFFKALWNYTLVFCVSGADVKSNSIIDDAGTSAGYNGTSHKH